jgi:Lysylphosphatidylglycerol synthase TM region
LSEEIRQRKRRALWKRLLPLATTLVIFILIFRRIPFAHFAATMAHADYSYFLLLMIPNSVFYFAWDTLVLTVVMRWFHGPLRYGELLPVRAVAYILALLNGDLAEGAMAVYLGRQAQAPLLEIVSTVIFLSWLELTHLAAWATAGMLLFPRAVPPELYWIPAGFALFWTFFLLYARRGIAPWRPLTRRLGRISSRLAVRGGVREWPILRTFRIAPLRRYAEVIGLKAPMFAFSLVIHYLAAEAFGFHIPFTKLVAFLPIVFMLAALPITVAHLGTTQAAWIFFFRAYATPSQLLAFSLAAHLTFMLTRGALGLIFVPQAYRDLVGTLRLDRMLRGQAIARPAATEARDL